MKHKQDGFSLLEVMIAMTVFSVFVAVYVTSQGYNISDSTLMREELMLQTLCENKINEIIISPPELRDSLTLDYRVPAYIEAPVAEGDVIGRARIMAGDAELASIDLVSLHAMAEAGLIKKIADYFRLQIANL